MRQKRIINEFKQFFEVKEFKRIELEDALVENYGSLQYTKYGDCMLGEEHIQATYSVGTKFVWGYNEICTNGTYSNIDEALAGLFLENCQVKETTKLSKKLTKIVERVYRRENGRDK